MSSIMKVYRHLLVSLLMASPYMCAPLNSSASDSIALTAECHDYEIPVTTQTQALVFGLPKFQDNFDVVGLFGNLVQRDAATTFKPFLDEKRNVTGNYTIGATFCSPKISSGHEKTVLLATPGLGYDKRYWASDVQPANYSFAQYAISMGYSIFMYDRLGMGASTKVSGYDECQFSTQLAILATLTNNIKQGKYTGSIGQPLKIVHVGHSYGSILTQGLITAYPTISDGIVLQGIGYNVSAFGLFAEAVRFDIANTVSPGKYKGLDNGYLSFADPYGNAAGFFHLHSFDKEILWYTQEIGQPAGLVEFLTGSITGLGTEIDFKGPVMIINGEHDLGNCGGNCYGISEHPAKEIYANASTFEGVVHPRAGHGINFNFNATSACTAMIDFVTRNGL